MKQIMNQNSIEENLSNLDKLINNLINDLKREGTKNQKKIIETCHAGKFLMLANYESSLELSENLIS